MWLFLPSGFLSVVVHRQDPDLVIVRARERRPLEDLQAVLRAGIPVYTVRIEENAAADYLYRATIRRTAWEDYLSHHVRIMEATNFKDQAARVRGSGSSYVHALHRVWFIMREAFHGM